MLEAFTPEVRRIVAVAEGAARELGHPSCGTEHVLLAFALLDSAPRSSVSTQ